MKQDYPKYGVGMLCRLLGKTRHGYYDALWRKEKSLVREDVILQEVLSIRSYLPRVGTRKLHYLLQSALESHGIKIGRDYLFDLLGEHKLLVRHRKRKAITTDSRHWMRKYSNLIRGMPVTRPEQVWVSDITYIRMVNQWGYLSLITDSYSRKIVGYCFRNDLMAEGCIEALQMAINKRIYHDSIIHHSDRGSQYCSHQYVKLLHQNNIGISMTENGDPYENALAERVNGIIKTEFNLHSSPLGFDQTYNQIRKSIKAYNEMRPHASCNYMTPEQTHLQSGPLAKRWKDYNKRISV